MTTALDKRGANLVKGSLADVAQQKRQSLAQTFIGAEAVVIVDTSGSMCATDSRGGHSRYTVACEELAALQASIPGKVAVLSFANDTMFCPDGTPYNWRGSTDLAKALDFAVIADVPGMRFIVVSDGEPNNEQAALDAAKRYKNKIDVIFVGPENLPAGRNFLARLAAASGGTIITADKAQGLLAATQKLLAVQA